MTALLRIRPAVAGGGPGEGLAAWTHAGDHGRVPTVTRATAATAALAAPLAAPHAVAPQDGPDAASRVRRLVGAAREHGTSAPDGIHALEAALARFDAAADIRIRGGLGSGRRTLAAALRERRGWQFAVDDLDALAAPGAPAGVPPDVEIVCLRTAPCRHEEVWVRRPRRHSLLVVATGINPDARPHWATGLQAVDARRPAGASIDAVVNFLDRALGVLSEVRLARLEAELERLTVHATVGDLAEAALCSLDRSGRP